MSSLAQTVRQGFPEGMELPALLGQLCDWDERENQEQTFSGCFDFHEYGRDFLHRLIDREPTKDRFGVFGLSGDASPYCIWHQDVCPQSVVDLSKDRSAYMVASKLEAALSLLAIGQS
jgi:hypothetical protein